MIKIGNRTISDDKARIYGMVSKYRSPQQVEDYLNKEMKPIKCTHLSALLDTVREEYEDYCLMNLWKTVPGGNHVVIWNQRRSCELLADQAIMLGNTKWIFRYEA